MANFAQQVETLKNKIAQIDDQCTTDKIEEVAVRLQGLNYSPPVVTPLPEFLRLDRQGLMNEVERILALPDAEACALAPDNTKKCEDLRIQYITVLLYYYEKLLKLRNGDTEEWDEVDELYVHD